MFLHVGAVAVHPLGKHVGGHQDTLGQTVGAGDLDGQNLVVSLKKKGLNGHMELKRIMGTNER